MCGTMSNFGNAIKEEIHFPLSVKLLVRKVHVKKSYSGKLFNSPGWLQSFPAPKKCWKEPRQGGNKKTNGEAI